MRCSWCEPLLDDFLEGTLRAREGRARAANGRPTATEPPRAEGCVIKASLAWPAQSTVLQSPPTTP